jgi:hypothetical protein
MTSLVDGAVYAMAAKTAGEGFDGCGARDYFCGIYVRFWVEPEYGTIFFSCNQAHEATIIRPVRYDQNDGPKETI